jgi:hypothetical protein
MFLCSSEILKISGKRGNAQRVISASDKNSHFEDGLLKTPTWRDALAADKRRLREPNSDCKNF